VRALKVNQSKNPSFEIIAMAGAVERVKRRSLIISIFKFLFRREADFSQQDWSEIERKRSRYNNKPEASFRDKYQHIRWHI
jgi:esterase/lipase